MSTLEAILSRMMSEPAFAEAVFADDEKALAEYNATPEDYAVLKALTRAEFKAQVVEGRKSMAVKLQTGHTASISFTGLE